MYVLVRHVLTVVLAVLVLSLALPLSAIEPEPATTSDNPLLAAFGDSLAYRAAPVDDDEDEDEKEEEKVEIPPPPARNLDLPDDLDPETEKDFRDAYELYQKSRGSKAEPRVRKNAIKRLRKGAAIAKDNAG